MEKEENKGIENILYSPNGDSNPDIANDDIEIIPYQEPVIYDSVPSLMDWIR